MEGRTMEGKKQRKPQETYLETCQETYLETCQETYLLLRSFLPKGRIRKCRRARRVQQATPLRQ